VTGPDYSADLMAAIERAIHTAWMGGWNSAVAQSERATREGLWPYSAADTEEVYRDWRTFGPGSLMPGAPPRPLRILGAYTNPSPELRQTYVPPPMPDPVELKAAARSPFKTVGHTGPCGELRLGAPDDDDDAYGPTEQL
jgi:hypothetical protein